MATLALTPKEIEDLRSGVADSFTQAHAVGYVRFLENHVKRLERELYDCKSFCDASEVDRGEWYPVGEGKDLGK